MKKSIIAILCLSTLIVSSMGITAVMHSDVSSGADTYDGYAWSSDEPTYNMNDNGYVATVNGVYYEDLGDAIEAAMGIEATVVLLKSCTLDHTFTIPEGTNLTLTLNNHVMICDKTLFHVESGVYATITIDTGTGEIIAPCIIDNRSAEDYCGFEAYISGNFTCTEKAFVFEDAKHVVFRNVRIDAEDCAIWCSHKGCDVLEMYNTSIEVTGENAPSAAHIITRSSLIMRNCDISDKHNAALEISAGHISSIEGCNFIGGAFDFQHDEDGYLVGSPQAAVLINNDCCGEINCERMSVMFDDCTFGYIKGTFMFPPIIISTAHNCTDDIYVSCHSLNEGGVFCLFRDGTQNMAIHFNGVEHRITA